MGKNLGIAFQIYDDVLDYMGTEEKIGKETMKDIREGKITMPLIYGLHKDNDLMNVLKDFSINTKELLKIKRMVEKKGGIDYSLEKAKSYAERARKAISSIESSPEKAILEALIDYSVSREN
jgi:geranylgeranyl pyrophosphate synthase